jgi:hypothetical protein
MLRIAQTQLRRRPASRGECTAALAARGGRPAGGGGSAAPAPGLCPAARPGAVPGWPPPEVPRARCRLRQGAATGGRWPAVRRPPSVPPSLRPSVPPSLRPSVPPSAPSPGTARCAPTGKPSQALGAARMARAAPALPACERRRLRRRAGGEASAALAVSRRQPAPLGTTAIRVYSVPSQKPRFTSATGCPRSSKKRWMGGSEADVALPRYCAASSRPPGTR